MLYLYFFFYLLTAISPFFIISNILRYFIGIVMVPMSSFYSPPAPVDFKINRPFLFLILHKDKMLFAGTYTK